MSRYETPDPLEAPSASYPPAQRAQIALEARLQACPACASPLFRFESNKDGAGGILRARFLCDAGVNAMVMPSGAIRVYGVEPCRPAMQRVTEAVAAEAAEIARAGA